MVRNNTSMQEGLLPLFPLEVVLLPGTPLPLHIFEPRYKEMFGELLASDGEFGVVLARGGGVMRTGCSATVTEVLKRYDDGRLDVMTIGGRRFRILELNTERSFFRARVEYFDDPVQTTARKETVRQAVACYLELARLTGQEEGEPDLDDPELSFELAAISSDLDFRQTVLDMVSEAERIEAVAVHLQEQIAKQRITAGLKEVSKQNGHGKHLPLD